MKLCRIGELGKEKPAIIDKDGSYKDLSSAISDLNPESLNFEQQSNCFPSRQTTTLSKLNI